MDSFKLTMNPLPPFDFNLTVAAAAGFKGVYGVDYFDGKTYRRLLEIQNKLCLAEVNSQGTILEPCLEVTLHGEQLTETLVNTAVADISRMMGTGRDIASFYLMAAGDETLAPLVVFFDGLHLPQTASVLEQLLIAIIGQQISAQASRSIRQKLVTAYGRSFELNDSIYYAFPTAETLYKADIAGLRSTGLSGRKAEYIYQIASSIYRKELDLENLRNFSDEEILKKLLAIRGIGDWTANWALIRALGRDDGFPVTDLALLRALKKMNHQEVLPKSKEAVEYSRRWMPMRSYVTSYIFAALRSGQFDHIYPGT